MIVLVPTCDHYADILPPFIFFFEKNWPDCPYRKVFINSPISFVNWENYQTPDNGWIGNILHFIEDNNIQENILLLLDDYLLVQKITTEQVQKIDFFVSENKEVIGSVRLITYADNNGGYEFGWPSRDSYDENYNLADMDKDYRMHDGLTRLPFSFQPAIWNPDCIRAHFNQKWTPWEQEIFAGRELCDDGSINGVKCKYTFITTKIDLFYYCNGIAFGKYARDFINLIKNTPELVAFKPVRDMVDAMNSEAQKEQYIRIKSECQVKGKLPPKPLRKLYL